jgi:tetratricopeptide (TPR) repeat protein
LLEELRDDPGNCELLFDLADLAISASDWRGAASKYEQIIELEPDHEEAFFELGKLWLSRGNPEKALICFERAEDLCGDEMILSDLDWRVGEVMVLMQRYDEAKTRLERAAALDPDNAAILHLLGDALLALREPDNAANCCRRVLASDAENAFAHHKLGVCLVQTGNTQDAIEHFRKAIDAKPDLPDAMLSAAVAYVQLGRWSEAKEMLAKHARLVPEDPDARELSRNLWRYRLRGFMARFTR